MESKDLISSEGIVYPSAARPAPLQLDPAKFEAASDTEDVSLIAIQDTPTPSTSVSPTAMASASSPSLPHGRPRSLTQGSAAVSAPPSIHGRSRSATIANPPKSAPPGGAPPEREKRKRSRVTPEQLTHLERLFALDRSPTAAKRKEISEMLGMQERQTQIWFQNRRAKAKTLEGKGKPGFRGSPHSGGDSPPDTPSDYNSALDMDLSSLIHEDDPVTFIPCSDLTIGSWRRISASLGQHDLVAYMSNAKRCFTWFIYSNGYGFKMEIPFDTIARTSVTNASAGQVLASLYLSRPPLFYLESMSSPSTGQAPSKIWKICQDWTEGQQASKVFRHDLVGAAAPLLAAFKSVPELTSSSGNPPPPFHPSDAVMSSMHIPQPPLASLDPSSPPPPFPLPQDHLTQHGRRRSFSGPPVLSNHNPVSGLNILHSQAASSSAGPPPIPGSFPGRTSLAFNPEYTAPLFRTFPALQPAAGLSLSPLADFTTVPISHSSRPFPTATTGPGEPRFTFDSLTGPSDQDHFSPTDTRMNQQQFSASSSSSSSSSPLLLTSAFDPSTLHHHHDVSGSSTDMDLDNPSFPDHTMGTTESADPSFPRGLDMPPSSTTSGPS